MVSHFKHYLLVSALVAVLISYDQYEKKRLEERQMVLVKEMYVPLIRDLIHEIALNRAHSCCQCCDELKEPQFIYMDAEELYTPLQNDLIFTHSS